MEAGDEDDRIEAAMQRMVQQQRRKVSKAPGASLDAHGATRHRCAHPLGATSSTLLRSANTAQTEVLADFTLAFQDTASDSGALNQLGSRLSTLQANLSAINGAAHGTPGGTGTLAELFGESVADFVAHTDASLRCTALASIRLQLASRSATAATAAAKNAGGVVVGAGVGALGADVAAATPAVEAALLSEDASVFAAALECVPALVAAALPSSRLDSAHAVSALKRLISKVLARAELCSRPIFSPGPGPVRSDRSERSERQLRARAIEVLALVAAIDSPSPLALVAESLGVGLAASTGAPAEAQWEFSVPAERLLLRLEVVHALALGVKSARLRQLGADGANAVRLLLGCAAQCALEPVHVRAHEVAADLDDSCECLGQEVRHTQVSYCAVVERATSLRKSESLGAADDDGAADDEE